MQRAALVVLIAGCAACAASVSTAGSGRTVVHHFHGFQKGKIAPAVHVTRTARGYCWETSAVESRRYAWRCFRGNVIHDPCFSAARHSGSVICPLEPWSSSVVRLRLTRRLPSWQSGSFAKNLPVGIWTTTGKRCVHSSGATSEIEGKPITYVCVHGNSRAGVLVGFANRATSTWTIWFAPSFNARHLTRVGITDAWW